MQGPGFCPGLLLDGGPTSAVSITTIAARLSLGPQQPSALPLPAALLLGLPLVVQLLAAGERKLELGAAFVVEIEPERHQRHSLALDRAHELVDLTAAKEGRAHTTGPRVRSRAR